MLCRQHPIRVLFLRQTRKSLTDSVLVEWEKLLGEGHPAMHGRATRTNRSSYKYPNGAEIVLFGLENPERTYSAQYDLICCFEAHEIALDAYEKLFRANRNFVIPWQQIVCDTNPSSEYHWLNRRFPQPHELERDGMVRLLSVHKDNPVYFDGDEWTDSGRQYMNRLESLTGARRARLLEGRWVSEEGQVWESYQPTSHLVNYQDADCSRHPRDWEGKLDCVWYYGGVDWGYRNPGWLGIFGVDRDGNDYLVAEWYQSEASLEWWADAFGTAWKKFQPMRKVLCDPSRPDGIRLFNDHIGGSGGRDADKVCTGAVNEWESGAAQVRWGFEQDRLYICRGALQHSPDPLLVSAHRPVCLAEEIPSYVFLRSEDGRPTKEKPDPTCADHACDGLRYAYRWRWKKRADKERGELFEEGTMGDILDHSEVLRK